MSTNFSKINTKTTILKKTNLLKNLVNNIIPHISYVIFFLTLLNLYLTSFSNIEAKDLNIEDENAQSKKEKKNINNQPTLYYLKQIKEVMHLVEKLYIEKANHQEMVDEGINAMLKSLDPHSSYITDEDLEFLINDTQGEFGGIGVQIIYDKNSSSIKVISPLDNSVADKAGIESGDYIVGVNGKLVSNIGMNKSLREMRGTPGTKLNLLIVKSKDNSVKELELTREIVELKPVKYEIEEDKLGDIAYLRIASFNHKTFKNMKKALDKIHQDAKEKERKLSGIIMDLRNNPGGVLDGATDIVQYFVKEGIILSVEGKDKKKDYFINRHVAKDVDTPLVVMINQGSASASEIVAGALQDHNRAIILGTKSFGKGIVQNFMTLNKRSGLTITTAKYTTPSGRSINAKGITPDIYIENQKIDYKSNKEEKKFFTQSSIKSYLKKYNNEDSAKEEEIVKPKLSKRYKEDYQYARSFDLIRGLIINRQATLNNEKIND